MELNHLPVIDWALGLRLAGNQQDLANDLLALAMKSLLSDVATIKQCYAIKNYEEMQQQAHKLHGALCYLGLPRIKILVAHIETELKEKKLDDIPLLLQQLDTEVTLLANDYNQRNC